jgi:D-arabinose 1-dehydrogenase-like Zn-dependent alcohol dehydrogenase
MDTNISDASLGMQAPEELDPAGETRGKPGEAERPATHMRIVITRYGGPEQLRVIEEARPEPGEGEVRVRVLAAGVSLPDLLMREGVHPETPRLPFTPGWDLVGVVERLGAGVSGIRPGQVVAALPIIGAYAEVVCLPRSELVAVPPGLDPAKAVALVLNYVTAYQMLHRSAHVGPGPWPGWRCTAPARPAMRRSSPTSARSPSTTGARTSWK